jgi:solute carrier family 25 iron transporter 28/37
MNVPFGALIVTINETLKHKYLDPNNSSLINYYLMAGIAGLLASVPTCPLDVIKTRLNVQHCMNKHCQNGSCTLLRNNQLGSPGGMSSHHSYDLLTHRIYRHAGRMRRHMRYNSVRDAALRIYQEAGFLGFFKGLKMRVLIQSPSSAISWGTYETFKRLLTKKWEV